MSDDLISRESAIEELDKICCPDFVPEWYENAFYEMKDTLMSVIQEVPSTQPKTGRWIPIKPLLTAARCSECKRAFTDRTIFCPNCGAKMKENENE